MVCDLAKSSLRPVPPELIAQAAKRLRDKKVSLFTKALQSLRKVSFFTKAFQSLTELSDNYHLLSL